jgi:hypothetical protein
VLWAGFFDRDLLRRRRFSVVAAAAVVVLALVETVNAVVAPLRAPGESDWKSASATVRSGFRTGDLIIAAPAWADPVMRQQLGDLVPRPVAGRMDAARYGRVWEISQRDARAAETAGGSLAQSSKHRALTVKLWEKKAAQVTFDFLSEWRRAELSVVSPSGDTPCAVGMDRFVCMGGVSLKPELLEIDTTLRNGLALDPIERATVVLTYSSVPLGRELAVAGGLHNVWLRKAGDGKVHLRVLVDGREVGALDGTNQGGWALRRFDTSAWLGKTATVRFEITVDKAQSRRFGFAAEARNP